MANAFYITNTVATGMLNSTGLAESLDAGTAAVINIYSGTAPSNADASLSGNTLLAQLTCSGTAFSGYSDTGTAARATFAAITADSSADATGTATFFRLLTQNAGTVIAQGTVGTATSDLILNTTSITSGSTVSITAATIDLPEGP
jgi:hypothetical protein